MDAEERQQRTEQLARQIWEAEGRPEGQHERHWYMAERLVAAEEAVDQLPVTDDEAHHGQA